jgi:hypothetical protein
MAGRSRTSFQKRQKEIARMEKQRDKAAKRAQRRLAAAQPQGEENPILEENDPPPDTPSDSEE